MGEEIPHSKGDKNMEKKDLIFLATSVLMVKSEKGDILNEDGKDYFKKYFAIYHHLLEGLYETLHDKNLKK